MHWARWGDPAEATPLPEAARGLVELAFGPAEERATTPLERGPAAAARPGRRPRRRPARAGRCRARAHRPRDPGPAHPRQVHDRPAADARGRRLGRPRRRGAARRPRRGGRGGRAGAASTGSRWCRSAEAPRWSAAWPPGGTGTPACVASTCAGWTRWCPSTPSPARPCSQAGLLGPAAEALLGEHGLTLGHFPQSFEYASIGGFAATRSSGQASSGYGRFDALVVGLTVATPLGTLAAGLRTGERGRAGPARAGARLRGRVRRDHLGHRAGPPGAGGAGLRRAGGSARSRTAPPPCATWRSPAPLPTVLRLSDENETAINLASPDAGRRRERCRRLPARRRLRGAAGDRRPSGGPPPRSGCSRRAARWSARSRPGLVRRPVPRPRTCGTRCSTSACSWRPWRPRRSGRASSGSTRRSRAAVTGALADDRAAGALPHLARVRDRRLALLHGRRQAARRRPSSSGRAPKTAASDAIIAAGATISHHHAVGRDHKPWLAEEIGPVGVEMLRAVKERLDPQGVLNPGVLVP